jgi:hypothetical protein
MEYVVVILVVFAENELRGRWIAVSCLVSMSLEDLPKHRKACMDGCEPIYE